MKNRSVTYSALFMALCLCFVTAGCGEKTQNSSGAESTNSSVNNNSISENSKESKIIADSSDWRDQRSYSDDLLISSELTVCLSRLDDGSGYCVINSETGEQIGTLSKPDADEGFFDEKFKVLDYNGDDANEIGVSLADGQVQWYCYADNTTNNTENAFSLCNHIDSVNTDKTCYPFEDLQPEDYQMSDEVRAIYNEIYPKIARYENWYYDTNTYGYEFLDNLLLAIEAINTLHPETSCYLGVNEDNDDLGTLQGMGSHYSCRWQSEPSDDIEEIKSGMEEFERRADEIVASITDDMTAYQKYLYLAEVISSNATYDYDAESSATSSPWSGIMGGYCICSGYSASMQYLCKKADLYCTIVEGLSDNTAHAWNLVKLPSGTYHVDVTWSDSSGDIDSEKWMKYFMVTQQDIETDHEVLGGVVATGKISFY